MAFQAPLSGSMLVGGRVNHPPKGAVGLGVSVIIWLLYGVPTGWPWRMWSKLQECLRKLAASGGRFCEGSCSSAFCCSKLLSWNVATRVSLPTVCLLSNLGCVKYGKDDSNRWLPLGLPAKQLRKELPICRDRYSNNLFIQPMQRLYTPEP